MQTEFQPDFNITGALDVLREKTLSDKDTFSYSGLWLFTGGQGSGKTLLMMHAVKKIHEDFPDALIISNISIFGVPCIPYSGIEDFDRYANGHKGCIFVIDEIHTLYSSLESKNMPISSLTVWSQNRKNRRVILGTSQRFNRVAKGLREQTKWNYECRAPLLGFLYSYSIRDGTDYDDNGIYTGEKPSREFYIPRVSVMRMYNTFEVVRRENNVNNS